MQIKTPPWRGPRAEFFPSRSYFYLKSFLYLLFHSQAFVKYFYIYIFKVCGFSFAKYFCFCNFKVCGFSFGNYFCICIFKFCACSFANYFCIFISKLAAPHLQNIFAFAISKSEPSAYIKSRPLPLAGSLAKIPFFIFKTIQTRPTVKIIWPRPEIPAIAGTDTAPSLPITS